ncbi:YhgE/Pip domain-containing protein [Peribacillus frigoritolerans]|uniref:YhgE/Pip domain-containing protein n=1 Tax=Peribacillus frigoritolerans TaxID=450367 RepID=UPI00105A260F|nr:YhgE/Pip domain-containing protein [Peribacillus frigoritolerans]TDL80753.1 YhgE/Pip domain-containing protein [Peribacillus frigoritolerans]
MSLIAKEWKALVSNKKVLIPVLAVLFIPLMYAGMFLWAFWDPYEQLDQLPVAVVNEDTGADYEGTELKIGSDLVDNLRDNPKFKWDFVSKDEAVRGLENEQYYMMIEIPGDFSKNATTLMDKNPQSLELKYVPNEGFNFLSGQIGGTAVAQIKEEVSNTITKTYAESIFENIDKLADGIGQASDGASEINNGVGELKDGSGKLKENLQLLAEKSISFKDGLNSASAGTKELSNGIKSLDSGLGQLQDGGKQLQSGSSEAEAGTVKLNEGLGTSLAGMTKLQESAPQLTDGSAKLSAGAGELSGGLNQLAEGNKALSAGAGELSSGLNQLTDGSKALSAGAGELSGGLNRLYDGNQAAQAGASELSAGLSSLNDQMAAMIPQIEKMPLPEAEKQKLIEAAKGVNQLSQGSKKLESSLGELSAGANKLQSGAATLSEKSGELSAGANKLQTGVATLSEKSGELSAGANKLQTGAATLSEKSGQLAAGQKQVETALDQLVAGQEALYDGSGKLLTGQQKLTNGLETYNQKFAEAKAGSAKLAAGSGELNSGISKLADGSSALQDGTNQLADGAGKVDEGVDKLSDGTGELSSKLGEAAEETKDKGGSDKTYDMISEPVKVKDEKVNAVPNYGTGFAPYFLSLGLFVGALLLSIVFPLRQAAGVPKSAIGWFMSKFGILAVIGVIQALLADAVLLYGLNIEVQSVPYFVLFSIITSLTFITLVQFLVTTLGDPGRFVAIIILILQLTTSAGTFPLELIPNALQIFNAWLPMTYSVSGFKAVISSGDFAFMWQQAGILAIFIAAMMIGTIAYFFFALRKNKREEAEELAA